jgi:hypothetical protein
MLARYNKKLFCGKMQKNQVFLSMSFLDIALASPERNDLA